MSREYTSGNPFLSEASTGAHRKEANQCPLHAWYRYNPGRERKNGRMLTYSKTVVSKDIESLHSFPAIRQQKPHSPRRLGSLIEVGDVLQVDEPRRHEHIEEIPLRPGDAEHLDRFELAKHLLRRHHSSVRQSAVKCIQVGDVWEQAEQIYDSGEVADATVQNEVQY